jgi:hypothetical protein
VYISVGLSYPVITNNAGSEDEDVREIISPATYFTGTAVVGTGVAGAGDWSEHPAMSTPKTRMRLIRIPYRRPSFIVVSFDAGVYKIFYPEEVFPELHHFFPVPDCH